MMIKVKTAHGGNAGTNLALAVAGWGGDPPHWVRLLAARCDASSQRAVADRLGKSSPYVSRLLRGTYNGNLAEAETIIRAAFGGEQVSCPLWGPMPLANCLAARRRTAPALSAPHQLYAATCPTCPNNTDRVSAAVEETIHA